jgi:hypothetical protein
MVGVVLDAELPQHDFPHAAGRPEVVREPRGDGALADDFGETSLLLVAQLLSRTEMRLGGESLLAAFAEQQPPGAS